MAVYWLSPSLSPVENSVAEAAISLLPRATITTKLNAPGTLIVVSPRGQHLNDDGIVKLPRFDYNPSPLPDSSSSLARLYARRVGFQWNEHALGDYEVVVVDYIWCCVLLGKDMKPRNRVLAPFRVKVEFFDLRQPDSIGHPIYVQTPNPFQRLKLVEEMTSDGYATVMKPISMLRLSAILSDILDMDTP